MSGDADTLAALLSVNLREREREYSAPGLIGVPHLTDYTSMWFA